MARRIRRRKRVSHSTKTRGMEPVKPEMKLPEAKPVSATRVLIAAPGPMRTVLTSKISGSTEVQLAAVADNEMTTVEKVLTEEADVVAIYVHLGGELAGLDIARNVAKAAPQAGILVIVNDLAGVDVRRNSRMFGVAWSYAVAENVTEGTRFVDLVQSVGRGIHWIDPELKRVLEAIWQIAGEGKDLEAATTALQMRTAAAEQQQANPEPAASEPEETPRGIQTMQAGTGGVGKAGFGVASVLDDIEDEEDAEDDDFDLDAPPPRPGGIQTMQTGKGGIGSDGFGVSKAG